MNKCVVISTNGNDDYLFYIPVVMWAWNRLGWEVLVMMSPEESIKYKRKEALILETCMTHCSDQNFYLNIPKIKGVRDETITQCARLYAGNFVDFRYMIMTSDADMMPLSDYWKPNPMFFTSYGRDLSDRHFPICYLAGSVSQWQKLMKLSGNFAADMSNDLSLRKDVHSDKFEDYWQVDQELITERISRADIGRVDRGISPHTGYPIGRVDRSAWKLSFDVSRKEGRVDAHLFRKGYIQENWDRIMLLIREQFPAESEAGINWMENYREQYIKLL